VIRSRGAAAALGAWLLACCALPLLAAETLVLERCRLVDGTGAPAVGEARVVIEGERIRAAGPAAAVAAPPQARRIDLPGRTVLPGLIDLHFHIEDDPRLALRQLAHGVTSFRDPGQWNHKFDELKRMMAAEGLPGPRMHLCGPHIDGEGPAYPADSVVARDAEEARALAVRNVEAGASALKIYFRLPLAGARAVIAVCKERGIPCTAHLEILDARDGLRAGLDGLEHITSFGTALLSVVEAEAYRQAVLRDNNARRYGRYRLFSEARLDGPEVRELLDLVRTKRPFVDPTLAVFERRASAPPRDADPRSHAVAVSGFENMKRLALLVHRAGARLVMGGHSSVPFAGRGEAPWRELELLVESGLTPLEAIQAATLNGARFLFRERDLGSLEAGKLADLIVVAGDPGSDISALRRVERVMVGGAWIDRGLYSSY
jgi:imidazolonepropionase-like amidohydrolase